MQRRPLQFTYQLSSYNHDMAVRHSGDQDDATPAVLFRQVALKFNTSDKVIIEVKTIYEDFAIVITKCPETDSSRNIHPDDHQPSNGQWVGLILLYRTLLLEHHNIFVASQYPGESEALGRLNSKYAMPSRMWRHANHSFFRAANA